MKYQIVEGQENIQRMVGAVIMLQMLKNSSGNQDVIEIDQDEKDGPSKVSEMCAEFTNFIDYPQGLCIQARSPGQ